MLRTSWLGLTVLCATAIGGEIHVLPKYKVNADLLAQMIPCDQVQDIRNEARPYSRSFDFSVVTVIKAPNSKATQRVRCYLRDATGVSLKEITNDSLRIPVDDKWPAGFLSSNQPAGYSAFYFMLKPRLAPGAVKLGDADRLLRDYIAFSERRLNDAIDHYGAAGSWCIDLRWMTVPDEIAFVATSPGAAEKIGHLLGTPPDGLAVRVSQEKLAALVAQHGANFAVANFGTDIDCVTPWRSTAGRPPIEDHAALFQVGWVQYRRQPTDEPQADFVAVAMDSAAVPAN